MVEIAVFILVSIPLFVFTLRRTQRHRFPRLCAFENFLVLVLLNSRDWFRDPFSLRQMISWIFLAGSFGLAIHGFILLRTAGFPGKDIEETTQLITKGAYRYIRHPLYCSLFLGGVGALLKDPSILSLLFFILVFIFVFVTAKVEERDNIEKFGDEYLKYMKTTKMIIPFLI